MKEKYSIHELKTASLKDDRVDKGMSQIMDIVSQHNKKINDLLSGEKKPKDPLFHDFIKPEDAEQWYHFIMGLSSYWREITPADKNYKLNLEFFDNLTGFFPEELSINPETRQKILDSIQDVHDGMSQISGTVDSEEEER